MNCAGCGHLEGSHMPDGCEVGWMTYVLRDIIVMLIEKGTSTGYKLKKLKGCSCRNFKTVAVEAVTV